MICRSCRDDKDHENCREFKRQASDLDPAYKVGSQWCDCLHRTDITAVRKDGADK